MPYADKEKELEHRRIYLPKCRALNREEIKRKRRIAYLKNKEKVKIQSDKYYQDHREEKLKYDKERHKNNRSFFNEYAKNKRYNDSGYRLRCNVARRIISAIKRIGGIRKYANTYKLLGCSIDFLRKHLQQTAINNGYVDFDINNYSGKEYHIDHIIPCAVWNLKCSYHQKLCFNYFNLQILKSVENIRKSDKIAA